MARLAGFPLGTPRPFIDIRVVFRVRSDAPAASIEELCQFAQSHSPVADTVMHPTRLAARVEVLPAG
jgi:hypothetical protein